LNETNQAKTGHRAYLILSVFAMYSHWYNNLYRITVHAAVTNFIFCPLPIENGMYSTGAARDDLAVPRSRTTRYGQRGFVVSGPTIWNSLPLSVRDPSLTLTQFCARLKTMLFCTSIAPT